MIEKMMSNGTHIAGPDPAEIEAVEAAKHATETFLTAEAERQPQVVQGKAISKMLAEVLCNIAKLSVELAADPTKLELHVGAHGLSPKEGFNLAERLTDGGMLGEAHAWKTSSEVYGITLDFPNKIGITLYLNMNGREG